MALPRPYAARRVATRVARRVAAKLVTGPFAFLFAGVLDWVVLLTRYLIARARGRGANWYES